MNFDFDQNIKGLKIVPNCNEKTCKKQDTIWSWYFTE